MKRISIISLCLLLLAPVFHLSLLFTFYQTQKKKIITEHCVNLYQPELDCYGKCYINEIIAQHQSDDSAIPTINKKPTVFLFHQSAGSLGLLADYVQNQVLPTFLDVKGLLFIHSIFHPPK